MEKGGKLNKGKMEEGKEGFILRKSRSVYGWETALFNYWIYPSALSSFLVFSGIFVLTGS